MARHDIRDWQAGLSKEEQSEWARKGGVASGEARRTHRLFRDILKDILTLDISADNDAYQALTALGLKPTHENAVNLAAILKAVTGDIEAARFVRDTLGEKPTDAFNLNVSGKPIRALDLSDLSDSELEALADSVDEVAPGCIDD